MKTLNPIGIIGGSGLYKLEDFKIIDKLFIKTPYGEPSDEFIKCEYQNQTIYFLARHGKNHSICPHELNHKANIWAMKNLGVKIIISFSAVGSLSEEISPQSIVVVDQFIDFTSNRKNHTFFGEGVVAHPSFAEPFSQKLREILYQSSKDQNIKTFKKGTYINIDGPGFSSKAESKMFRNFGADIIGMTNVAEAKLSKESQIAYATLAMVTDYDSWRENTEAVTLEIAINNLQTNVKNAKNIIKSAVSCIKNTNYNIFVEDFRSMEKSIITEKVNIPKHLKSKLGVILGIT